MGVRYDVGIIFSLAVAVLSALAAVDGSRLPALPDDLCICAHPCEAGGVARCGLAPRGGGSPHCWR